jgi:hypothetical protein
LEKKKKHRKSNVSYSPARTVVEFMTDALQLSKETEELGKKISAAGGMKEATGTDIDRHSKLVARKRTLDKRKVDLLNNHIFPSMANLIVLLEGVMGNAYLAKVFREDLQALFFAKSTTNKNMRNAYVFWRFANAVCSFNMNKTDLETGKPFERFRLILCDIMQESINDLILTQRHFIFNDEGLFVDKTLSPDMERARAWTRMLCREAYGDLKFDKDRRPALF